MAELVSILRYNPTDPKMILLRSRLEEEGIPTVILNEYAAFRRGNGSVDLQVMETDLEKAIPILKEMKFPVMNETDQNPFYRQFNSVRGFPLLQIIPPEMRLFAILIFIAVLFTLTVYLFLT